MPHGAGSTAQEEHPTEQHEAIRRDPRRQPAQPWHREPAVGLQFVGQAGADTATAEPDAATAAGADRGRLDHAVPRPDSERLAGHPDIAVAVFDEPLRPRLESRRELREGLAGLGPDQEVSAAADPAAEAVDLVCVHTTQVRDRDRDRAERLNRTGRKGEFVVLQGAETHGAGVVRELRRRREWATALDAGHQPYELGQRTALDHGTGREPGVAFDLGGDAHRRGEVGAGKHHQNPLPASSCHLDG